jgi:hypothetical protein
MVRLRQFKDSASIAKKCRNISNYYLVSLPLFKTDFFTSREVQDIDSFRIRKGSTDGYNNESVSFRQNSKQLSSKKNPVSSSSNTNKNSSSNKMENKVETAQVVINKSGEGADEVAEQPKTKRKRKEPIEFPLLFNSEKKVKNEPSEPLAQQKSMSE